MFRVFDHVPGVQSNQHVLCVRRSPLTCCQGGDELLRHVSDCQTAGTCSVVDAGLSLPVIKKYVGKPPS